VAISQRLGWIGVDVGTHAVKLAQVVRDGANVRLHRAAVIQRPITWTSQDSLGQDQPCTSQVEISAALDCGGFTGRNAICSLPMNVCQLRSLSIPPGSEQERRTIIADELAEEFAEIRSPMEFDFWEMESARGDKGTEAANVSVLVASRPWVGQIWNDCRKAGMDCWAIDGLPLSMARGIGLVGGLGGGRRVLAVDWGYSNTTLSIVGDDRPLFTRRIQECAFGHVLDAIVEAFAVTKDEAQHLAEAEGLPLPNADRTADSEIARAIAAAAAGTIDELIRQLSRTLQFMEMQRRHLQPSAVWLLGGGASLKNIGPWLSESLHLPVHIVSFPLDDLPIECATGARSAIFANAAALSALAWRDA